MQEPLRTGAPGWDALLQDQYALPYFADLCARVATAYRETTVFPPREDLFAAFRLTPPEAVRCVLLGQDPYHGPGQAHGLSFSVREGVRLPPSLRNIFKEMEDDTGEPAPQSGDLTYLARQGVLLLNTVLTVEQGKPNSHRDFGWRRFTAAVLEATNALPQPIAFLLWGGNAIAQGEHVRNPRGPRLLLQSAHPSPLSAYRGFFGSRPFSQVNRFLADHGAPPIRWGAPVA